MQSQLLNELGKAHFGYGTAGTVPQIPLMLAYHIADQVDHVFILVNLSYPSKKYFRSSFRKWQVKSDL